MPNSKKFEAFVEPGAGDAATGQAAHCRKRSLRSHTAKAGKRSKGTDAAAGPLSTLATGNSQHVASRSAKGSAKGATKEPATRKVHTLPCRHALEPPRQNPSTKDTEPVDEASQEMSVVSSGGLRTPTSELDVLTGVGSEDHKKSGKKPVPTKALQVSIVDEPTSRSRSNAIKLSPTTKIGEIFNIAHDDVISEVIAAIHLTECPKAMLINKAWYKGIAPRIMALESGLRYRRWLASEMKTKKATIGKGLIKTLDNSGANAIALGKLTFKMHSILIDWLVDVAIEFRLSNATLALTSNVLDRFLAVKEIEKKELQLLGVTCMWIASKMEEVSVPLVSDFAWITYDTYTVHELRAMERTVLNTLNFSVSRWIPMNYLNLVLEIPEIMSNEDLKSSISFVHELVLHEPRILLTDPDILAAGISYSAISTVAPTLHKKLVSEGSIDFMLMCKYDEPAMQELIDKIDKLPAKAIELEPKWQAVLTKYRKPIGNHVASKYFGAPALPEPAVEDDL